MRWVLGVLVLVVGLAAGATLTVPDLRERVGLGEDAAGSTRPPPPLPRLALGPLPADAPMPTRAELARELDELADAPELGTMTGVVLDAMSGRRLWSRQPDRALVPGSTVKLLTAAAALLALDHQDRLTTRVVAGGTPGSVVLVGGGDPTLSALPTGAESVYPDAAKLDELAAAVTAAHPGPIRSVTVDVSRYSGPTLAPGWLPEDVPGGYVAPIVPVMLDGGRTEPAATDPPRVSEPALAAGRALAERLGADPASVTLGPAPGDAPVLAEIRSAPITQLVETTVRTSDNVLAEALAREVALATGAAPTFAGAAAATTRTLAGAGFDVEGVELVDGSGLSTEDRVPARLLAEILMAAAGPRTDERAVRLRPLLAGLPVAAGVGTLDDRFGAADPSAAGRGFVRAKTGTLTGVSSLAGLVTDADKRLLVFALISNGTSPADARPRLDAIAAALR